MRYMGEPEANGNQKPPPGGERIQAGASEHRERCPCVDVKGKGAQGTCGDRER